MLQRCLLRDPRRNLWLEFTEPVRVLCARTPAEVMPVLQETEERVNGQSLHAAGFVSYEAASGFDPALCTHPPGRLPLVLFGLYPPPRELRSIEPAQARHSGTLSWNLTSSKADYIDQIRGIREQIGAGNVYQINHTLRLSTVAVDPRQLFALMAADARYAAWLQTDFGDIVSASPELFFELNGETLRCQPMKGTAARAPGYFEDEQQRDWLQNSAKNRAENLMITDMVRNDLGRLARPGSVNTDSLFDVARYPTVWQMTSSVRCRTDAGISGIFRHLFPGASITGAPKNAAMKLIRQLETTPREIYTGAIGHIRPGRRACFSIAIRTAWQDQATGRTLYGAGGGIVWDSDAEDEYAELLSKARILKPRTPAGEFELLETLLWQADGGYHLLEEHLQRLARSAEYFDYPFRRMLVVHALEQHANCLQSGRQRVRLRLDQRGRVDISSLPLVDAAPETVKLRIYPLRVNATDPMLYHKTTHRGFYDEALSWAGPGEEAIFVNEAGFVTESPIANLVYELRGRLYTPPIQHGLLPGTLRQRLLDDDRIEERPLPQQELGAVSKFYLINGLRGWRAASLRIGEKALGSV